MPETLMIILDNSFYSQNQDISPTRFIAQKRILETFIHDTINKSPENSIGFAPLANTTYQIITPSSDIQYLISQLTSYKLSNLYKPISTLNACHASVRLKGEKKTILLFLGCKLDINETVLKILKNGIDVYIAAFGDGKDVGDEIGKEVSEYSGKEVIKGRYHYVAVEYNQDLYTAVMGMFGKSGDEYEDDPELAMAIKLSLLDR